MTPWTKAREVKLSILWPGHSAASIAAMPLFEGLTKNAIIGKISRMGLAPKTPAQKRKQKTVPAKRRKIEPRPPTAPWLAFKDVGKGCRYPHDDADGKQGGDMLVCGEPTLDDFPYCGAHHKAATMKRRRRK